MEEKNEELLREDRKQYVQMSLNQSENLDKGILATSAATFGFAMFAAEHVPEGYAAKIFGVALCIIAVSIALTIASFFASERHACRMRAAVDAALESDDLEKCYVQTRWRGVSSILNWSRFITFALGISLLGISIAISLWR